MADRIYRIQTPADPSTTPWRRVLLPLGAEIVGVDYLPGEEDGAPGTALWQIRAPQRIQIPIYPSKPLVVSELFLCFMLSRETTVVDNVDFCVSTRYGTYMAVVSKSVILVGEFRAPVEELWSPALPDPYPEDYGEGEEGGGYGIPEAPVQPSEPSIPQPPPE
jgi:hypothetical protein